jgi:hypothetical protein
MGGAKDIDGESLIFFAGPQESDMLSLPKKCKELIALQQRPLIG